MISHTEENYLKAIFSLTSAKGKASVNDVSKQLGIKKPTANSMMKRLAEKGLVEYESYKPPKLTDKGKKEAALIIRKHRLTEMYLAEKMGFGWEEVHDIAEQIEHIQSTIFFKKMDELLGYPKVDPHGSPIPNQNGVITSQEYTRLSDAEIGSIVILMRLQRDNRGLLKYLNEKKISLHTKITVEYIEPFDRSMNIRYDEGATATLSKEVCDMLLVEFFNEDTSLSKTK